MSCFMLLDTGVCLGINKVSIYLILLIFVAILAVLSAPSLPQVFYYHYLDWI